MPRKNNREAYVHRRTEIEPLIPLLDLYIREKGICYLGGHTITYEEATREHVTPKSKGGLNLVTNIRLACETCNRNKGSQIMGDINDMCFL